MIEVDPTIPINDTEKERKESRSNLYDKALHHIIHKKLSSIKKMRRILELNFSVINHHLFQFYKVSFHQFKPKNKMKEKDFSVNQDNHLGKSYTLFKFQVTLDPLKNIMYMQRNSKKQRKHKQLTVGSVTASSTSNVLQSLGNMDEAGNSSLFTIYLRHELTQKEMIQMHHGKLCHQH